MPIELPPELSDEKREVILRSKEFSTIKEAVVKAADTLVDFLVSSGLPVTEDVVASHVRAVQEDIPFELEDEAAREMLAARLSERAADAGTSVSAERLGEALAALRAPAAPGEPDGNGIAQAA